MAAVTERAGETLRTVRIDSLEIDEGNIREELDAAEVEGFRQVLRLEGKFMEPPRVYETAEGRYCVWNGNTRVAAAKAEAKEKGSRLTHLPVLIGEPPFNNEDKLLGQLSANILQASLSPIDVGTAILRVGAEIRAAKLAAGDKLPNGRGWTLEEMARKLRERGIERKKAWVELHILYAEIPPILRGYVRRKELGARQAVMIAQSHRPPEELDAIAARAISEKWSVATTRRMLNIANEAIEADLDADDAGYYYEPAEGEVNLRVVTGVVGGVAVGAQSYTREDGSIDPERFNLAQIHDLSAAAEQLDLQRHGRPVQRAPQDPERRAGRVAESWEIPPVPQLGALRLTAQASVVQHINAETWARQASARQKGLASELAESGRYKSPDEVASVVASAHTEEAMNPPQVVKDLLATVNAAYGQPRLVAEYQHIAEVAVARLSNLLQKLNESKQVAGSGAGAG